MAFREVKIISLDKNFKIHINMPFTYAIKKPSHYFIMAQQDAEGPERRKHIFLWL